MKIIVETNRLLVRNLEESDTNDLFLVLSNSEVMQYIEPPYSMEQTQAFIHNSGMTNSPLVYALVWKANNTVIGHVIWHPYDESSYEIGWIIHRGFWHMGIASELTEALIQHSTCNLVIECDSRQIISRHIAEKFGFKLSGHDDGCDVYRLLR